MTIETETYVLPASWSSMLIYGDATGYEDDELAEIERFLQRHPGYCIGVSEETWFARRNDANSLGDTVATYTFQIV